MNGNYLVFLRPLYLLILAGLLNPALSSSKPVSANRWPDNIITEVNIQKDISAGKDSLSDLNFLLKTHLETL